MNASAMTILGGMVLALTACAEARDPVAYQAQLEEATRTALGERVAETSFTVTDIESSPTRVTWRVDAGDAAFACDADDKIALPACRPIP